MNVKADAVTPLRLAAEALTSKLRIQTTPAGAAVAVDGVSVGRGRWEGKLRPGKHRVEIAADGFVLQVKEIDLATAKQDTLDVTLERDPLSPLWKDNRGRFFVEANVGPWIVPTFGGAVAARARGLVRATRGSASWPWGAGDIGSRRGLSWGSMRGTRLRGSRWRSGPPG